MGKLTAKGVQSLSTPGKYADGDGLYLNVAKGGQKSWIYRYQVAGKRREIGLGGIRDVTLAKAREKTRNCRDNVLSGRDPLAIEAAPPTVPSFTSAAAGYVLAHRRGWANRKHARQWLSTLKTYARPVIGEKPVDEIQTEDILSVLKPIWTSKTETGKRVQGRVENILDYAAAMKWRDPMNPARWRGHLDKLLPKPSKVKAVKHHPAMPYPDVPAFMVELQNNGSLSAKALQLLILTAVRTGEVLGATWDEIDLEAAVWTIPADRMKAKREHRVPLSGAALEILEALPRLPANPYVFFGQRPGRPLSNMALLQLMRGMGYGVGGDRGDYVPHGFRSSFRDWSGEVSTFPRDVAEMALAHTIENKVEAAYRRGDLFEKRRKMMESWANWCQQGPGANVVAIRGAV
jgi:integrase